MFCQKCGKEIEDNAKFCDGCGENLQSETSKIKNANINALVEDGKQIARSFFSKNPGSAIDTIKNAQSKIGLILMIINIVLFGFVSCFNVSQTINHTINSIMSSANSTANSLGGDLLVEILTELEITNIKIPVLFDLFLPLILVAAVISALIFIGIYLIFKLKKTSIKDFNEISNYIGVNCVPLITALILNFVIGFVFPQVTVYIFILGLLVSFAMLYENLKNVFGCEGLPIIEITILITLILVAFAIIVNVAVAMLDEAVQNMIISSITDGAQEIAGSLWN